MIVYIYNIGVDLYNGFNGLRHRINWTYFTVLDGLAHPLYSFTINEKNAKLFNIKALNDACLVIAVIIVISWMLNADQIPDFISQFLPWSK